MDAGMSRRRHLHPAGRASVISAVVGITLLVVHRSRHRRGGDSGYVRAEKGKG